MPNYTTNFKPNYLLVKLCVSAQCWMHGTNVINSVPFWPKWRKNTVPASKPEWYNPFVPPRNKFRIIPVCSGRFGKYRPKLWIRPEWVSREKKLTEYKEKSYEPRWGGKIKGSMGRWEEKNQEKKTKGKRR